MSLDGLRAWIGVVERRLTLRTRVFLVLVAIAIGGAAAGIVLAIDTRDNAVSKDDLQVVRDELAGGAPVGAPDVTGLEAELATLREEVAALRAESGEAPAGGTGSSGGKADGGEAAPQSQQQLKEAGEEAIEAAKGQDSN